jgi:hypothetical protein
MGGEVLVYLVAAFGLVAFVQLCYRSWTLATRPYALPTLLISSASAAVLSVSVPLVHLPIWFFLYFLPSVGVFGAQALCIRWLREGTLFAKGQSERT